MIDLAPGDLVWTQPDPSIGSEQSGRRPALVVSGTEYLNRIDRLAVVVPVTSVNRRWPNHVEISGGELDRDSWAMTEQVRAISRKRIVGKAGRAHGTTLVAVRIWIADFLEL